MTSAFQTVYDYGVGKAPQLAPKNTMAIHEWIAAGYDPERDILPAINEACKRGSRTIQGWHYFTGFIRTLNEKRVKGAKKQPEYTKEEKEALRAKNVAWHRQKGLTTTFVGLQDFDWLEGYEKKHGRVEI